MSIRDLAYLGRWKSSVVLIYAEEALESTPANRGMIPNDHPKQAQPKTPAVVMDRTPEKQPVPAPELVCSVVKAKASSLWVKSTERGGHGPLHLVDNADWSVPLSQWASACGWTFAKNNAHISFVTDPGLSCPKCRKCSSLKRLRDDVNEGVMPAQLIADDFKQLNQAGEMKTPRAKRSRQDRLQTPPR